MGHLRNYFLRIVSVLVFLSPLSSNAACSFTDKKVSFSDGSSACLNEFSFLNIKGLMKSIPNESYASKANKQTTFAIAVTAQPMLCPFEQSMQWNWSGADGSKALNSCETKMNAAVQTLGKSRDVMSCKCEVLIDNGKVKMTRTEFEQKTKQYEKQISLGLRAIQVAEGEPKITSEREAEAVRVAEFKKLEDEKLIAMKALEAEAVRLAELKKREDEKLIAMKASEAEAVRLAELKKREDEKLIAMKERADREEAQRKNNAPTKVFASRKALLFGNDSYKYANKLDNARQDANSMATELKSFGYEVTLKLDQTQKEMQAALREFREKINEGDEVLFYFSGHAVEIDGKNYLTPIDTIGMNAGQLADDSIDLKFNVLDPLSRKKVKLTLALIDACRDNPFLKNASTRSSSGSKGLAPTTPAVGQLIVYSAGSGQTALDRLGPDDTSKNGLFTRVFLQEMKKVDLSIDRVIRNVRAEVVRLARTIGHDQVPAIYDEVVGDFYFRK